MSYSFLKMLQAFYPFECFGHQNIAVATYYNPLSAWWRTHSLGAGSSDISFLWPLSPPLVKSVSISLNLFWIMNPSLLEHVLHDSTCEVCDMSTSLPGLRTPVRCPLTVDSSSWAHYTLFCLRPSIRCPHSTFLVSKFSSTTAPIQRLPSRMFSMLLIILHSSPLRFFCFVTQC